MKARKNLLLLIACGAAIASSAALAVGHPQPGEPGSASQSLSAGTVVVAHSLAEIANLVEPPASRTTANPPLNGGRMSGVGRLADSSKTRVPIAAGPDGQSMQATGRRSSGPVADSGHVPTAPEPAGWLLLLSGFAVAAGIVRRRASWR